MGTYKFVEEFRHLGMVVNGLNERGREIDQHTQAGYRMYFVYRDILKIKKIRHITKTKICKDEIRAVVMYRAESDDKMY